MSSPSFYTAAGNFLSAIQGGVDPRTGLFNVNLPLINLQAGDLAGPGLALALRYSPLSSVDEGFGRGFALNLTRYDIARRRLHLSTGESYSISNSRKAVRQHKFRNFIFEQQDGLTWRVIHKSGLVETLASIGSSVANTTGVTDPVGRVFYLQWRMKRGQARLDQAFEFTKGKKTTLFKMTYSDKADGSSTIRVLPDSEESGYNIVFTTRDGVLRSVTGHATDPALNWMFDYDLLNPFDITKREPRYLVSITSPVGLKEEVIYPYLSGGAAFPDGIGLPPLPQVSSHYLSPGGGQPVVTTRWEWTAENYLGRNMHDRDFSRWRQDIDPMLSGLHSGYVYGSTAKILDAGQRRVLCAITRRYNSFHLQVSESTLRDGKTHTVSTEYHARSGATMGEQPRQYLLPSRQTRTWVNDGLSSNRVTRWKFDASGNPLQEISPDGVVTRYVWYPAQGEGNNCPADPHGFTRYLKSKTVIPPKIKGDEPVSVEEHTWKKLQNKSDDNYFVVGNTVTETIGNVRTTLSRDYYGDLNNPLTYGREKLRKTTLTPDLKGAPDRSYTQKQSFLYDFGDTGFTQSERLTTHDGLVTTRSTLRHPFLGHLLSETDAQGIKVTRTYDKTGRVLTRTAAPGSAYENTTTWAYVIENTGPVTTETDASGNKIKTFFDGAGRKIRQQRLDKDNTQKWYDIWSRVYNTLGETTFGEASDWLTGAPEEHYVIRTGLTYDGWGSVREQSSSDGMMVRRTTAPQERKQTVFAKGSVGGVNLDTATRLTVLDERTWLPWLEKLTATDGKSVSERYFSRDGLRRLRTIRDELNHDTTWTYDAFGRVLTQRLPDGTTVSRSYAPHLTGHQVAAISVTGIDRKGKTKTWGLGTQEFDGLGRVTRRVSGGRTTLYTYDGVSPVPASVTLPSGNKVTYTYIPELGYVVHTVTADGVTQSFRYDSLSGEQLTAKEGTTENGYIRNPSGSLRKEMFTRGGNTREASYTRTLAGVVDTYKDVTGKKMNYMRDGAGRLTEVEDDEVTVSLAYDALGRLSSQVVKDRDTQASLTTTQTYDDFGREVSRVLTDSNRSRLAVTQTWTKNNLLASRDMQRDGVVVRREQYVYDTRNRLTEYKVTGSSLPQDAYGQPLKAQKYQYDALNNLTIIMTTLGDGSSDTTTYHYGNSDDPTQLTSLTHTHDSYPQVITLTYDAEGRMTQDDAGRRLGYDALGRLSSVSGSNISGGSYGYDALNRLVIQNASNTDVRQLYYRGGELINEMRAQENKSVRLIKTGHACLGVSDGNRLTLTAGDHHDSLQWSRDTGQKEGEQHSWTPYGSGKTSDMLPGFNGERVDPVSGTYHLGNGYRAYNPVLGRFTCPDSLSPFGAGGINAYAYCAGDPVNRTDPSGHISTAGWVGIGFGIAGLALSVVTAGLSIAVAGSIAAALGAASTTTLVVGGVGVMADVTAIASGATEDVDPEASSVLGWISMATGLAGLGIAVGGTLWSASGAVRLMRRQSMGRQIPGNGEFLQARAFSLIQHADEEGAEVRMVSSMGYVNNFAETGEPMLTLHGGENITQYGVTVGIFRNAPEAPAPFTVSTGTAEFKRYQIENLIEILRERHGIDLYSLKKPLHFISCCSGGDYGQAQRLANILKIPIKAYGNNTVISTEIANVGLSALWYKEAQSLITNADTGAVLLPATYYPHYVWW